MNIEIKRKTFSKILVAIHESSKSADKAVDYATRIAQDYNAILVVLYVVRTQSDLDTVNLPSHVIHFKKQAESYLGKISDAIVSYARDKHIDLIVVVPRGRSKLRSFVLGSVTSDVVRLAHCPVLTVR